MISVGSWEMWVEQLRSFSSSEENTKKHGLERTQLSMLWNAKSVKSKVCTASAKVFLSRDILTIAAFFTADSAS